MWNILPIAAGVIVLLLVFAHCRWMTGTRRLRARLEKARAAATEPPFDDAELADLPPVVARYFRAVLSYGQPAVPAVTLRQTGFFTMDELAPKWKPFTATQRFIVNRPGFDWDARIRLFPGVTVRVHDSYIAGEGSLHAAVFGLFTMAREGGTTEMARGELMRFFAETPWFPMALLPRHGVKWVAADASSALACLTDGPHSISLLFHFNAIGLIDTMHAGARSHGQGNNLPWMGRYSNYAVRSGMLIPLEAEVAWIHPSGPKPYCRVKVTSATYERAT